MAKPKTPNQKNKYSQLNKRLAKYVALVRNLYDVLNLEAAKMAEMAGYSDKGKPFHFKDYPKLKDGVKKLQNRFVKDLSAIIYTGTSREWKESNLVQDLVADNVLKTFGATVSGGKYKQYYHTNSDALKAFQERRDKGLNLSQKIWNQSQNYRDELEYAISAAIEKGTSAVTLSKQISKYLENFKTLQRDYKEKYGKAVVCHDCHYKSIRLARSEINLAYRTAEQKRWEQMDFVVGQEIKLSNNHTCNGVPFTDICDDLAGKYPKDFKFTGWHPMCRCYVIPILKTEDEFWSDEENGSVNEIKDTPKQFKDWISSNKERIKESNAKGTLPYFVRDNIAYIENKTTINKTVYLLSATDKDYLRSMGMKFNGFGDDIIAKYNNSAIKGFDLKSFDDLLESVCDENKIRIRNKTISILKNGNVNLVYTGRSVSGESFILARDFIVEADTRVVSHNNFALPKELQGKGISKKIMKSLFEQYENMDIDLIRIYANNDIGGYAWAKYGFSAIKEDAEFIIESAFNSSVISQTEYNAFKNIIGKYNDIFPMNLISSTEKGKDILLGTWWNGVFNMKDKKQLVFLKDYIGF